MWFRIDNFKLTSTKVPADIDEVLPRFVAEKLAAPVREVRIISRSLDARRGVPSLLYSLLVDMDKQPSCRDAIHPVDDEELAKLCSAELDLPPSPQGFEHAIVVGSGPCGIFAGLALAMAGCRPLIIDRGGDVEQRGADWREFLRTRKLNPESNLLIGEGGAGTYSDGKLYTGTRDARASFVLKSFVEAGAPPEIRYLKRPHIGSDNLTTVAANLRRRIIELGGSFRFNTEICDVIVRDNRCTGVITAGGERLEAPAVLLAHGLGGRDLNRALRRRGVPYILKGFQLGCRIEHPQQMIDRCQYHLPRRPAALGAAEYNFVSRPAAGILPVSTFCMCPGGETVMASAWENALVSNGMSCHARAGEFANSALIVTLSPDKFADADAAFALLEQMERGAFKLGGGDYTFPAQDAAAFLRRESGLLNHRASAANGLREARLDDLFIPELRDGISAALQFFDRQCPGFIREGKLIGLESCVSSPVRFVRDAETLSTEVAGLYIGGEGGGCAGGIMSAATDGLKLATAMLRNAARA